MAGPMPATTRQVHPVLRCLYHRDCGRLRQSRISKCRSNVITSRNASKRRTSAGRLGANGILCERTPIEYCARGLQNWRRCCSIFFSPSLFLESQVAIYALKAMRSVATIRTAAKVKHMKSMI